MVQGDHAKIIREVGAASMVLLKNLNTTLPLTAAPVSYGIFGGDARANPNGINSYAVQTFERPQSLTRPSSQVHVPEIGRAHV